MKAADRTRSSARVGAGPGDPELLTMKALRAIRSASVLLVDDLVSAAVLDFALCGLQPQPRIVHVGKRGGCASTPQAFIERLMVGEAKRGERVVRLKGGDPFIFGRGGEEAERLRAQGIRVDIVNGITAGSAAAASLGVPLTHREHAHGVMLVTGHGARDADGFDIAAAARTGLTLVIYMGVSSVERLQQRLLTALPADTPAAAIENVSLPQQRQIVTTLGRLGADMRRERIGSPAVLLVGKVLRALPGNPAVLTFLEA